MQEDGAAAAGYAWRAVMIDLDDEVIEVIVAFEPVWSLRNRTNAQGASVREAWGGYINYGQMFVHTAANLLPPAKYFKDHLLKAKGTLKARKTLVRQTELKWWDLLWHRAWPATTSKPSATPMIRSAASVTDA